MAMWSLSDFEKHQNWSQEVSSWQHLPKARTRRRACLNICVKTHVSWTSWRNSCNTDYVNPISCFQPLHQIRFKFLEGYESHTWLWQQQTCHATYVTQSPSGPITNQYVGWIVVLKFQISYDRCDKNTWRKTQTEMILWKWTDDSLLYTHNSIVRNTIILVYQWVLSQLNKLGKCWPYQ